MEKSNRSFKNNWIVANTLALFVSYLFFTPIAHGITGAHEYYLTIPQLIAHCIGLLLVGLSVFLAQRYALKPFIHISWLKVIVSTVIFMAVFQMGYYQQFIKTDLDTDILFGFTVLGSAMWMGTLPVKGHWWAIIITILCFPFASFIGEVLLLVVVSVFKLELNLQSNLLHHIIFWLSVALSTGLLGGWIGGMALSTILPKGTLTESQSQV